MHGEEQNNLHLICTINYTVFSKNISVTDCHKGYISGRGFPFPLQHLSHLQAGKATFARHSLGNFLLLAFCTKYHSSMPDGEKLAHRSPALLAQPQKASTRSCREKKGCSAEHFCWTATGGNGTLGIFDTYHGTSYAV